MSGLVVEGVCRGFRRGRGGPWVQVLSDVCFDVRPGEVVGVVGARLLGKTTLLRVAAGLDVPEQGSVRLGATELTGLSDRGRAALRGGRLMWVSRRGMSQRLEAAKIVGWPLAHRRGRRETERRAAQMLERVGAAHCAGRRWDELSPWEQVLVGLAQGFAGDPEIVVIDDLLDALGIQRTEEASDLMRLMIDEAGGRCGVLMSACDSESVLLADRVWSLEQGGKLIPTAGHHRGNADILPFRGPGQSAGPRRMGRL